MRKLTIVLRSCAPLTSRLRHTNGAALSLHASEVCNGFVHLLDAVEACVVQCLTLKDAKPHLDLIEPTGAGGREMESDIGVRGKPVVVFLVRAEVIQDDVDLPLGWLVLYHLIHECLEVGTLLGLSNLAANNAGDHFQTVPCRL